MSEYHAASTSEPGTGDTHSSTGGKKRCRRLTVHVTTALMGLTATVLMSGGLHFETATQDTPRLFEGPEIATAAIGWSAVSTAIIPGIQAAARWPAKKAVLAMITAGAATSIGTSLTAVAAHMETSHARYDVYERFEEYVKSYGTEIEVAKEIDTIQIEYQCCGSYGPGSYRKDRDRVNGEVPDSCCAPPSQDYHGKWPCDNHGVHRAEVHQDGCGDYIAGEVVTALHVLTVLLMIHAWTTAAATAALGLAGIGRGCQELPRP